MSKEQQHSPAYYRLLKQSEEAQAQMNETAKRMFAVHTHAEIVFMDDPDGIVYREKDVIALLVSFGVEPPIWARADPANNVDPNEGVNFDMERPAMLSLEEIRKKFKNKKQ